MAYTWSLFSILACQLLSISWCLVCSFLPILKLNFCLFSSRIKSYVSSSPLFKNKFWLCKLHTYFSNSFIKKFCLILSKIQSPSRYKDTRIKQSFFEKLRKCVSSSPFFKNTFWLCKLHTYFRNSFIKSRLSNNNKNK